MFRKLLILCILALVFSGCHQEPPVKDTFSLLSAMKSKYRNAWYNNLTFEQQTDYFINDSLAKSRLWLEAMQAPDKIIVKFDSFNSGAGMLFRNDSMYEYHNFQMSSPKAAIHDLLLMSFGVYHFDPAVTMSKLSQNNFNTAIFRSDVYNGKEVYVIGAETGDSVSNQIWIERERLLVLWLSKFSEPGLRKVEFSDYTELEGSGYAPGTITFMTNGKKVMSEKYMNVRIPSKLDAKIFNPEFFYEASW